MSGYHYPKKYDVIVVGTGHAGCEAALAASRMGCRVLALTLNVDNVALMSCNPAIGGLAKGQIVREIDALGGEMGKAIDKTGIQFRMLNTRKGPAVWAPRAQADKQEYRLYMKKVLEEQNNLDLKQGIVTKILLNGKKIKGVQTKTGTIYLGKTVIIATGTFMKGVIHIGHTSLSGGRGGEISAEDISECLRELGLKIGRLKTGTTPRLDARTIDFSKTTPQPGDETPRPFSFATEDFKPRQIACFLTYTNAKTHKIIRDNIKESALYSGKITGVGPRYCPSIEDKVTRFADKDRHQVFLEPEGIGTREIYTNGFSSSLSEGIQIKALRTIEGLEKVEIIRPAYAIEYDYVYQYQIKSNLETKSIEGLFLAGQINGTSGYEEAAAQGIIAGINAVQKIKRGEPLILKRSQAYIGVLIDDLVTRGTEEPYRMFTSRAEYRLLLRQDNADARLRDLGFSLGLVSPAVYDRYRVKMSRIEALRDRLSRTVKFDAESKRRIAELGVEDPSKVSSLSDLLKRPGIKINHLKAVGLIRSDEAREVEEQAEITIKYEGYIKKQERQIRRFEKNEKAIISPELDYRKIPGLTNEAREKLSRHKPDSLGQASRISGVSPADISVLMVYLFSRERKAHARAKN